MKVLVIGSGGREHAIVWKLSQSKHVTKLYCAPGSPGTSILSQNIPIPVSQKQKLVQFAKSKKIDLTFVGPEAPLIEGIVDLFQKNNLSIIGPTKKAARLEGSKAFAKKIMEKYNIPTAQYKSFRSFKDAKNYLRDHAYPLVIKASGHAAGKGVLVAKTKSEAIKFLKDIMVKKIFGSSGNEVVIEEYLEGKEISFMVASDGKDFVSFIPSQDHKRIFDGDRGPNTGGMGAYAPVPFVDEKMILKIEREIVKPIIAGMKKERIPYEGILYPGLIITREGPKVLEFNCRFGDPETQPVLTLLKTDLLEILLAIKQKKVQNLKLSWNPGFAVCVVLASDGYPGNFKKGSVLVGLDKVNNVSDVHIFHSATTIRGERVVSSGGRVISVTAVGNTLNAAIEKAYLNIGKGKIYFPGMHYRHDIGKKGLIRKKNFAVTYSQVGDNYDTKDPILRLSQKAAAETALQLKNSGFSEVSSTRGSSAFVWEQGDVYMATVLECLGTKNLVADETHKITGKTYYDVIAHDTVATFVNDISTVGAKPLVCSAYWAIEDNSWLQNRQRLFDFVTGWKNACIEAGCTWGGGETPTLKGIITKDTADLGGSVVGIIVPKKRLITDDRLKANDRIIFLKSNGPNANGISLIRKIAEKLPKRYATKLPNGKLFGEEVLQKSHIYSHLIQKLFLGGIDIHYIVNITGHGLRKLMRAKQNFSYIIEKIFQPQEVFLFIQKHANLSDYEMYQTYNMGMDYALFLDKKEVPKALSIIKKNSFQGLEAGYVAKGPRKVLIDQKKIIYNSETYKIR
ncbi:phosphoribosylamine--glycine ligase [Candidatus Gottesmanbacteria bacterium]|nr:phosphoribosylamine--glycine ligase [Candidatus Gottesmanbacteria bacterium]